MYRIVVNITGYPKLKKSKDKDLNFGTWNIKTMLQPVDMYKVANEIIKYALDVVALQGFVRVNVDLTRRNTHSEQ